MATLFSTGHGIRRRSGIPSNPLEAAGPSMARSYQTSDEAYSDAAAAGSVRIPLGAVASAPALTGTLVPKHNVQAGDPTNPGSKVNRQNVEVLGASYRIQPDVSAAVVDPTIGPTMASARTIPSVAGRATPNFASGEQAAYL